MGTGTWTAACLLLATVGTSPGIPDEVYLAYNKFEIPIKIDKAQQQQIRALELYVSSDQGKTWHQAGAATPDQGMFTFTASADGPYWLTVQVIDQQNRRDPPDIRSAPVGQKVVIDTLKPDLRLMPPKRQGEEVTVSWQVKEEHPDLATLHLEYRSEGGDTWVPVSMSKRLMGQAVIRNPSALTVRLKMSDRARNAHAVEVQVPGAAGVTTAAGPPVLETPPAGVPLPPVGVPDLPSPSSPSAVGEQSVSAHVSPEGDPGIRPAVSITPVSPRQPLATGSAEDLLPPPHPPGTGSKESSSGGVVASSPTGSSPAPAPAPPPGVAEKSDVGLQVVNNRRVTMEYEVAKFGPSGIGSVELYLTRDNGMTWKRVEGEHGVGAPQTNPGSADVLRRTLSVDLTEDGVYGFYLIVKSGAGLGKRPPRSGDTPQMRVELDTSLPEALLYGPQPSPNERDTLVLAWKASDNRMPASPITLQWAERKEGPWEYIGGPQLANTGTHNWRVSRTIPPKVYLRLTVRDAAGNVAVAETRDPVLVDLSRPEGRILGLVKNAGQ